MFALVCNFCHTNCREISPRKQAFLQLQAGCPVPCLHHHSVWDKKKRGILGANIKVSVEKENGTAGKKNKAHELRVVSGSRIISF